MMIIVLVVLVAGTVAIWTKVVGAMLYVGVSFFVCEFAANVVV